LPERAAGSDDAAYEQLGNALCGGLPWQKRSMMQQ